MASLPVAALEDFAFSSHRCGIVSCSITRAILVGFQKGGLETEGSHRTSQEGLWLQVEWK